MTEPQSISPLTKVTLELAVTVDSPTGPQPVPVTDFSFVFGLGTQGLSPFEMELSGKQPGDRMHMQVGAAQAVEVFEHLLGPVLKALDTEPPLDFDLEVKAVSGVSDRELVKALAQKGGESGCGCGCDNCG